MGACMMVDTISEVWTVILFKIATLYNPLHEPFVIIAQKLLLHKGLHNSMLCDAITSLLK